MHAGAVGESPEVVQCGGVGLLVLTGGELLGHELLHLCVHEALDEVLLRLLDEHTFPECMRGYLIVLALAVSVWMVSALMDSLIFRL